MRRDWLEIFTFLPDFAKELGALFSSTAPPAVSRFVTPYLLAHEPERASIRHSRIQRPGGRRPGRLFLRARLVKRRGSTSDEMLRNCLRGLTEERKGTKDGETETDPVTEAVDRIEGQA